MAKNETARILVVDDTSLARQVIASNLRSAGFTELDEANDGKTAFLKIRKAHSEKKPFDMVLCDWNMPETDGLSLLKSCRAMKEFAHLPFIMVTAEGSQKKIYEALASGSTDYIVKPFKAEHLKSKVLDLLEYIRTKAS